MDRCALFVDAGYVLADGAMAVHGTRRGESVSWDYEGLLQLLSSLARERSGLPVLRCYWYEATVDGRRTAEQDALADVPGIKLRVAKIRPGRREGVETEIHRDLTTLARNNAISDALVISAEEDLAQVIADVQDLGLRVTLVHIAVDGNWTISRALRQESDDIMEISGDHLRPYVELIAGAEPVPADEPESADQALARPLSNGHSLAGTVTYQPMPATASHAPPAIYTAPVVAEYQRPAMQLPRISVAEERPRDERAREDRPREDRSRDDRSREDRSREARPLGDRPREDRTAQPATNGEVSATSRQDIPSRADIFAPVMAVRGRQDRTERPDRGERQDRAERQDRGERQERPDRQDRGERQERPDRQETASVSPAARGRGADEATGYPQAPSTAPEAPQGPGISSGNGMLNGNGLQGNGLPSGNGLSGASGLSGGNGLSGASGLSGGNGLSGNSGLAGANGVPGNNGLAGANGLPGGTGMPGSGQEAATPAQPGQLRRLPSARTPVSQPGPMGSAPMSSGQHALPSQGSSRSAPYSGPQPVAGPLTPYQPASPAPSVAGVSLSDAVQAAHEEGQEFGGSVARDAPALWLEAVLARKPRMPSDLEARLLQGSALPIDFLLHDEVRHALRRGFWDALERTRR